MIWRSNGVTLQLLKSSRDRKRGGRQWEVQLQEQAKCRVAVVAVSAERTCETDRWLDRCTFRRQLRFSGESLAPPRQARRRPSPWLCLADARGVGHASLG
jgi:hypothetical protein